MTSQFLENLSLPTLIAPVSEEEFRSRYWEREPMIVHRSDPDYYGELFTLRDFDEAITRSPGYVKVAEATTKKNVSFATATAPQLETILDNMRDGGTLILDGLHRQDLKLAKLCRVLGPEFSHRFQTNLYLTPPNGKGFTAHWDNHDTFILQVFGSKEWKIEKSRRTFPMKGEKIGSEGRELKGEVHAFTLKKGDLIYIPRGFVHAAECGAEPSLHITLGLGALSYELLLASVVRCAIEEDLQLREALPLGFMKESNSNLVARLKATLAKISDDKFLERVVQRFKDSAIKTFPLDISGQVEAYFDPKPIRLDDAFGPRRGMVYQVHSAEDRVDLVFGGRNIAFLKIFQEALDYSLATATFAVRDVPGDLADIEKIVFIERMMQEGLLVRR